MLLVQRIGAVVAGLVVAIAIVSGAEGIVHRMYPPPAGANMQDMAVVKQYVASMPLTPMLLVLGGWLLATFTGAALAAKLGQSRVPAYVVGGLLLCAGIANSMLIPQPVWFSIASFVIYIGAAFVASRVAYSTAPAS